MKQAEPCGILVRVLRLDRRRCVFAVPVPVAHRALDAVLVVQADVEPDGRIERRVLVQAEPGQVAVEALAVVGAWRSSRPRCPSRRSCGRRGGPAAGRSSRAPACRPRRRNTCWRRRWWPIGSRTAGFRSRSARRAPRRPSPLMAAVRRSHSTVSKGSATSCGQKTAGIESPSAGVFFAFIATWSVVMTVVAVASRSCFSMSEFLLRQSRASVPNEIRMNPRAAATRRRSFSERCELSFQAETAVRTTSDWG